MLTLIVIAIILWLPDCARLSDHLFSLLLRFLLQDGVDLFDLLLSGLMLFFTVERQIIKIAALFRPDIADLCLLLLRFDLCWID